MAENIKLFTNCKLLRDHKIVTEDLWVRNGKIINPEPLFFDEKREPTEKIDCNGMLIAPGLIDIQINGGFGVDFSHDIVDKDTADTSVQKVAKGILEHGCTSFCPTLVTSPSAVYHSILPNIKIKDGGLEGAGVLGVHIEGPFISVEKKGAHPEEHIKPLSQRFQSILEMYGSLENVRMITLAPELDPEGAVIQECVKHGLAVSVGHSMATLKQGEEAVRKGAVLITHLFNAMATFHHRDSGLIGLLTSDRLDGKNIFYGIIADNIHTDDAALRIAYRTNFAGMCLVTDAVVAMGLRDGQYHLGQQVIDVKGDRAVIAGSEVLCGAIANLFSCVQNLKLGARCSLPEALEAATLHPAQALGIETSKGTLDFNSDADFIMIDDADENNLKLMSTWIAGQCVFRN